MFLNLPYLVDPPRGRNERSDRGGPFRTYQPTYVRETCRDHVDFVPDPCDISDPSRDLAWVDGRLFAPVLIAGVAIRTMEFERAVGGSKDSGGELEPLFDISQYPSQPAGNGYAATVNPLIRRRRDVAAGPSVDGGEIHERAKAHISASLIAIDDRVYAACSEPVLTVRIRDGSAEVTPSRRYGLPDAVRIFRYDRHADVAAWCQDHRASLPSDWWGSQSAMPEAVLKRDDMVELGRLASAHWKRIERWRIPRERKAAASASRHPLAPACSHIISNAERAAASISALIELAFGGNIRLTPGTSDHTTHAALLDLADRFDFETRPLRLTEEDEAALQDIVE